MTIERGLCVGAYVIVEPLGAGGMGEVYRARDTRLGRDVAVKMLPGAVAFDAGRRTRFEREARVLASLNHPNIATLYGVEDSPSGTALVMELVDGETLANHIALEGARGGSTRVLQALAIAEQIAAALEAAHEQGVIHRDLKPANVVVRRDGTVKVLDFGLAKALTPASDPARTAVTVTVTDDAPGLMGPGTPAYMSPEQARGLAVDKRTDVWAFGCVLYELLSGARPFAGDRTSDVVARILERDPDFTALPPDTPVSIRRLLRRCLEKNPQDRLRDIGDARLEIRDTLTSPTESAPGAPPRERVSRLAWFATVVAASVVLTSIALTIAWWQSVSSSPQAPDTLVRATTLLPAGVTVTRGPGFASSVAVSPDGLTQVIAGSGRDGQRLYRRRLDRLEVLPIPGTDRGSSPFFSWDGAWIGFFADGWLKRVPAAGGVAVDIVKVGGFPAGASWGPDNRIVFSFGAATPLHVVDTRSGQPERLTDQVGRQPDISPDGRTVLYESGGYVHALDFATNRNTRLIEGTNPRYADGHLLFSRGTTLLAAPVDLVRHTVTAPEVAVIDGVANEPATAGVTAHYAVSRDGTLGYVPAARLHSLVLVRADGTERIIGAEQLFFMNPRFSPRDGRRLVFAARRHLKEPWEIWVHDFETDRATRLTSGWRPMWTPDGESVTFSRSGRGLYTKPVGPGEARQLIALKAAHWLVGWTPDSRTLVSGVMEGSLSSIVALADSQTRRIIEPSNAWGGRLSPDGRWLAYGSLDSGNFKIVVTSLNGGERWPIADGSDPNWNAAGNEIYYRSGTSLMAIRIDTSGGLVRVLSEPRVVVEPFIPPYYDDHDIHPDGRTLVYVRPSGTTLAREVAVVVNWLPEMRRLVTAGSTARSNGQ
jgi:eukaryotic-like serine/threonine-protein kinase